MRTREVCRHLRFSEDQRLTAIRSRDIPGIAVEASASATYARDPTHHMDEIRIMDRRFLIAAIALGMTLPISWSSRGHDTAEPEWCPDPRDKIQVVETFKFDGAQLREMLQRCGVVEDKNRYKDEWHMAADGIGIYCQTIAPGKPSVRAILTGPESFMGKDHHEIYRIEQGLMGGCVECIPAEPGK